MLVKSWYNILYRLLKSTLHLERSNGRYGSTWKCTPIPEYMGMYSGMGVHSQLYFISSIIELRSSIILENFTGFSDSASESLKPVKFSSIICNCFNPLTVVHHRYPSSLNIINIVFIKIVFIIAVSDHRFMIIVCVLKSVRTAANQYISNQLSSNYTDLLNMYFLHHQT